MNGDDAKYNNTKARYIAFLVLQRRHNKNRGIEYSRAVKENSAIKADIDYWLERYGAQTGRIYEN